MTVGKDDPNMMTLLRHSRNLYEEFENEEDGGVGTEELFKTYITSQYGILQ